MGRQNGEKFMSRERVGEVNIGPCMLLVIRLSLDLVGIINGVSKAGFSFWELGVV
jgi:hypothetical protein